MFLKALSEIELSAYFAGFFEDIVYKIQGAVVSLVKTRGQMIQPLQLSTWFLCRKGCSECSLLVSEEDEIAKSSLLLP